MKLKTTRPSKLRVGPLTPEQAIVGILNVSPEDVRRIREEEKKLKLRNKTK